MYRKEKTGDTGKRSPVIKESGIPVLKQRKKSQRKDRKRVGTKGTESQGGGDDSEGSYKSYQEIKEYMNTILPIQESFDLVERSIWVGEEKKVFSILWMVF